MKLVRFGSPGHENPGLVDSSARARDLSANVPDLRAKLLAPDGPARIPGTAPSSLPSIPTGSRLGPCVAGVGNFIAIGLNFADHAAETGAPIPAEPIIFNKAPSCIVGPNDDIMLPRGSLKT